MNFHICHVYSNPNCEAFTEVADLLEASLRELGYVVSKGRNQIREGATNIVLGANLLKPEAIPDGVRIIVYQLEQLWEGSVWWNEHIKGILLRADEVWDYDPANIAFLKEQLGIEAKHVIIGYHRALIRIPRREKDIEVLHFGSMNERRAGIIKQIEDSGVKVTQAFGVWGKERDELIARSKVVLNIHFYDAAIFEQVRVSYLLNNGVLVISEGSGYIPYRVKFAPSEILHLAVESDWICGCVEASEFSKNHKMTEILRRVTE